MTRKMHGELSRKGRILEIRKLERRTTHEAELSDAALNFGEHNVGNVCHICEISTSDKAFT
jgi:hypothetical protein